MKRDSYKFLLPLTFLIVMMSCKPAGSTLSESEFSGHSHVSAQDINAVTTTEILQLIRTTGDTYNSENFKTARYCANCIAQRRIDQIAKSMLEQQLRFLQGVFVDGAWGDFKMVVYDAPLLASKGASALYQMHKRFSGFLTSYGSMVSEYYTGEDYLGYGSENARSAIDKTVSTLMSMSKFLQEKGYSNAEALAKKLYMLYKNPDLLKNAIYDMVRLVSSGLAAGHGFTRSISCEKILVFFNNWIPRLMGLVAYEVLIDVVLGFVTAATAGAAGVALGAKVGLFIAKLGRIASKMPYVDEIIAGFKKLAELVVRLIKRGEDASPAIKQGDELSSANKALKPCPLGLGLTGKKDCLPVRAKGKSGYQVPYGFKSFDEFQEFAALLRSKLDEGIEPYFQGSSVTGKSATSGAIFDVGRTSDYDIALAGSELFDLAKLKATDFNFRVKDGNRVGPIKQGSGLAKALGLDEALEALSKKANREVNFMVYFDYSAMVAHEGRILLVP